MENPMVMEECVAGIHTPNMAMPEIAQAIMNIFHRPILSDKYPETRRPKRLAALKKETKY